MWYGAVPPQYIYSRRRFLSVVLDPPDFEPGSWVGAGNVVYDYLDERFLMAVRFRLKPPIRGCSVGVFYSKDGVSFTKVAELSKEEIAESLKKKVYSVEGVQILRDPLTCLYYLYVSIDIGDGWETALFAADDLKGPWECKGIVLRRGLVYDMHEARDPVIGIVDGMYFMLYRANDGVSVKTGLAVSSDGINWKKLGTPTLNGEDQPTYLQLLGSILPSTRGPLFVGLARRYLVNGCGIGRHFESYVIDYRNIDLELVFRTRWEPLSEYEDPVNPTHGYSSLVYDPERRRMLLYVETIDPKYTKEVGWRTQVDRWVVYEIPLPEKMQLI